MICETKMALCGVIETKMALCDLIESMISKFRRDNVRRDQKVFVFVRESKRSIEVSSSFM